jgi:hypothetical protein
LPPPPFASAIKCHQKSTSNSAGSSVGSLAPPRATPRLGGAAVSCQYFPCSFVLALRELGLRLGVKAPLPLRASSRGVLPGPGALEYGNRRLSSSWLIKPSGPKSRLETIYCFAALVLLWSSRDIYALWGRAMHPGPCDSLHLPQKLCRGSPSPENFVVICSLFVLMR